MKTITQYKADIKALMLKAADIDEQCIKENREPASAELVLKNEILDTVQEYQDIVKTMERQERMTASLESPDNALTVPRNARIEVGQDMREKDRFPSLGSQLMAVLNACPEVNGRVDPRLRIKADAASGLNETIPSDGGFLVQTDFSTELMNEAFETGILPSKCSEVPISGSSNSMTINGFDETSRASSRSGGIISYWESEADTHTGSKPKFRQIELKLKKLTGLCYATDEVIEDAATLESAIREGFKAEFGFKLDDAIINGTGAGMPLGILNAGCLVSVAKETGQAADTVMAENIMKMRSRLFASSRANSVWLINQNVEPQLHSMSLSVGTGGAPVYMPAGGLSGLPYDTLYGRPVFPIEQCASVGTVGDIIYGDFGGYKLATKGGMKSDMSIHVRFLYDESVFRFILRVDGQPTRASALTPYKGGSTSTQSHFIALASRD